VDNGDSTAPVQDESTTDSSPDQFRQSLLKVMQEVVYSLPDSASLGELVAAMKANPLLEPLLRTMSVQELIDLASTKPASAIADDEEGGLDVGGAAVIRRRADVPDGDIVVLDCLADRGPLTEASLARATKLTSEQVRLILRHLRTKGSIHIEGSGSKRRIKITRSGSSWLRKQRRNKR
jgi:hypothetical protein